MLNIGEEGGQHWTNGSKIANLALIRMRIELVDGAREAARGRPRAHLFPFKAGAEDGRTKSLRVGGREMCPPL